MNEVNAFSSEIPHLFQFFCIILHSVFAYEPCCRMCYFLCCKAFSVVKVRYREVPEQISLKFYIYSLKNDCKLSVFIVDHVLAHTLANSWLEYFWWLEYIRTYRESRVSQGDKACQVSVLLQLSCDLSSYSAMDRVTGICTCCFSDILQKDKKHQVMLGDNKCSLAVHRAVV